ncbi:MAG: cyclic nucleotide-binding domain-containing protein [Candidatus Limnocylindrales bacterium]
MRKAIGASDAYFILDGSATAGIPEDDGYRGLSTMAAGDFFGEIAALTGSPRTADVVTDEPTTLLEVPAAALRATMVVPEIQKLVLSTLTSRLRPDRVGRPAAPGRPGAGRPARPAHTAAIGRAGGRGRLGPRRPGAAGSARAAGSGTRDGSHRVDADHDRGARIHRELVADFAGPQELAEQSTFAEWQTDVDLAAAHGHARDDVVATVDRESASELVHRDVRAALDEAAQLRSRAHIAAVAMSVHHGTLGRGGRVGHGRHREPGGD